MIMKKSFFKFILNYMRLLGHSYLSAFILILNILLVGSFVFPQAILADHEPGHVTPDMGPIEIHNGVPAPGSTNQTGPGGQNPTGGSISGGLTNPFAGGADTLFEFLKIIMNDIVLPIGGVLAVLAFIYSGFLYVTAQGNETKLKSAHGALLATVIGTAILLGSWVLANVICETIVQIGGPACEV